MSKSRKALMAFIAGATAGAVAGLLLAPDQGKKTRKKIVSQADTLRNEVSTQWKNGSQQVRKLADQASSEVGKFSRKLGVS